MQQIQNIPGGSARPRIHLIANAHLDPVWLWDRFEGLNEAIATVRAVLDLMERFPEMTFIRGEAWVYEQIARWDPVSFERIRAMVEAGRWDIVGGNWIQPDTNLPGTEALCRQYDIGHAWFEEQFGRRPTCAWAADSFGHGAGFPEIYRAAGFDSFVFSRPLEDQLPLESSLFWWEGRAGSRVLAYRIEGQWYGMERDEIPRRLDTVAAIAAASPLRMAAVFYGLGNHGGGPSARHLEDIRQWQQAHPEVELVHSGLHRMMADFRAAMRATGWDAPVHRGELNFCLRGCYASSMATKSAYRRAEAASRRAEAAHAAALAAGLASPARPIDWRNLCFNAFHDILPGSSIESATNIQLDAMARLTDEARDAEHASLLAVARELRHPDFGAQLPDDHPLPQPVLLFNPHPWAFDGVVELEAPLDYRPQVALPGTYDTLPVRVVDAAGADLPFQRLAPRNCFLPQFPWRLHAAVRVAVPPMGHRLVYVGWWPEAPAPATPEAPVGAAGDNAIRGGGWEVSAARDGTEITLLRDGRPLFGAGGLRLRTVADTFGSWGGHYDEPGSNDLQETIEYWKIHDIRVVESGPLQARLWIRMGGASRQSRADLSLVLRHGAPGVEIDLRLLWAGPGARLKLEMPAGHSARYEAPGGTVDRGALGEVPGGRHACVDKTDTHGRYTLASDCLTAFNLGHGVFQCTLARSTGYARDAAYDPAAEPWRPLHDQGALRYRILLADGDDAPHRLAAGLDNPPGWLCVPRMGGARSAPLGGVRIEPAGVELLGIRPDESDGSRLSLRLLNHGPACRPQIHIGASAFTGGELATGAIGTETIPATANGA